MACCSSGRCVPVGRFDSTSDAAEIDIDALVAPFSEPEYWRKALAEDADEVWE
jgi:hypothetical protein